jgi:hypothetical protein
MNNRLALPNDRSNARNLPAIFRLAAIHLKHGDRLFDPNQWASQ